MATEDSPKDPSSIYPKADVEPLDGPIEGNIQEDPETPWKEDPDAQGHTDPEHARRLAAIRTELLQRAQQHPPTDE